MREVEIEIDEKGVIVKYKGFKGASCFQEAQRIYERLKAMGVDVRVEKTQITGETYQFEKQKVKSHE